MRMKELMKEKISERIETQFGNEGLCLLQIKFPISFTFCLF